MDTKLITNRKQAFLHLEQKQQGKLSDLLNNVSSELVTSFTALGFIVCGKDNWRLTSLGRKQCLFYREPTLQEKETGILLARLNI